MNKLLNKWTAVSACSRALALMLGLGLSGWAQTTTTASPVESNEILYNPGMGFADFMHGWGGPPTTLDKYPTPRVAYFRWYWSELEPAPGQYNFALVDQVIAEARSRNQDLAFRIMPDIPAWLAAQGVKQIGSSNNWVVDHNNPLFLSLHERLVAAFGARYSGSLDIDHVDIGSVGCWGEWNSACCPAGKSALCNSYMPTEVNRRATVNWYYKYFRDTPLVALAEGTGYANTLGAGWRGDCFGDYGNFSPTWNHMEDYYPLIAQKPEVVDAWQKAPVQFESCGIMQDWYKRGYNIDLILKKGLEWHMSVFNGKNSAVPSAWRPKVDAWLKKIGYRFVLSKLTHTNDVAPGGQIHVDAQWINRGVAPAYRRWPLAYRLRDAAGTVAAQWTSRADIRTWLPGSSSSQDTFTAPAAVAPGTYALDVALLREDSSRAYVRLAIGGARPDLWHQVSQIRITGDEAPTSGGGTGTGTGTTSGGSQSGTTASFVRVDSATKGNWKGVYGEEGYNLVQHAVSYPSYVTVTTSGNMTAVWDASTAESRAPLKAGSATDRIAACWYSNLMDINLAFNDGRSHQVAVYLLDWPRFSRKQKVEVIDDNGAVLDTRTVSGFNEGQYLVWNLSGSVRIRIKNAGSAVRPVVSGIFFR